MLVRSCVIDPKHVNDDSSTSLVRFKDLLLRDEPMFEVVALVFLTQPNAAVLRQLSECAEVRARLFGATADGEPSRSRSNAHVLVLDQHCVRMSDVVFTLNNTVSAVPALTC